jgi:hypothetical protein
LIYATVVDENGAPITAVGSKLAIFDGSSVAGVASPYAGPNNTTLFYLTVYSDQASVSGMTYQVYNAATGTVSILDETYNFSSGVNTGTILNPITLHVLRTQSIPLYQGWTWTSFNVIPSDGTFGTLLKGYNASDNDVIIGTKGSATYFAGVWYPSSSNFKVEAGAMYMISSTKNTTLTAKGQVPAKPSVTMVTGWNWIGYPDTSNTSLANLFNGAQYSNNDCIMDQNGNISTYWGGVWYSNTGATYPIKPGLGYLLYLTTPQTIPMK